MRRIIKNIIPFLTVGALTASPAIFSLTSCKNKDVEIESIKLSSRFQVIYPSEELKIKAKLYPATASKANLKWEVICPVEGFSISEEGKLFAPETFSTTESFNITIKATSKTNPEVFTTYDILGTNDRDHNLLGFAGGLSYLDRDGKVATKKILKQNWQSVSGGTMYYVEGINPYDTNPIDGINLYTGRPDQFFDFTPIFKTDINREMRFWAFTDYSDPLYNDNNCISWVGYTDHQPTISIPEFSTTTPVYKQQRVQVTFECDEKVTLLLIFDVYQGMDRYTPAVFDYNPAGTEKEEDKHDVVYIDDGQYKTQFLCDRTETTPKQRRLADIYLYRKLYEEMEGSLKGVWEPEPNAPDIFTTDGKPQISDLEFTLLPGSNYFHIAKFNVTYTIDPQKIQKLDHVNYLIGTYHVYDISDIYCTSHWATLEFRIQWLN